MPTPTFPTYRGELPQCLNPRNLRHYLMLLYWVYFRPTALHCYLYQADAELYRASGGWTSFRRALRVPAYRGPFVMMPFTVALSSLILTLPATIITSSLLGREIQWAGVFGGVAFGVAVGVAASVVFGVLSMAFGVLAGVMFGMAAGVVGVVVGDWTISTALGVAIIMVFGMAAADVAVGVVFGMVVGVAVGIAVGVAVGVVFGMGGLNAYAVTFGVVVGVAVGVAGGVAGGIAVSVAGGVEGDAAFSVAFGVATSIAFGVSMAVSAMRLPFYMFEIIAAACYRTLKKHPIEWDELTVLRLPHTRGMLRRHLHNDEGKELSLMVQVARNPFQRWAAQVALMQHLHEHYAPLRFLYQLLTSPEANAYSVPPLRKSDWTWLPPVRRLLLGELGQRWVDLDFNRLPELADRLVWRLTLRWRDRRVTPLTRFAGLLYDLERIHWDRLDDDKAETIAIRRVEVIALHPDTYADLIDYPDPDRTEIVHSFDAMFAFMAYDSIAMLPWAIDQCELLDAENPGANPVRPATLHALRKLGHVGAEIAAYQQATSRVSRLAALARATDDLDDLDEFVQANVVVPEQQVLRYIIRRWRRLLSNAGGEVGRAEASEPVANPYIIANPVMGGLLVGREDILRHLEALWGGSSQKPSVVLYGHRRMGKSSILRNLGARFGAHTKVVDFNMQRVGFVRSSGELLYNLATALYDALNHASGTLPEPHEQTFIAHNPYSAFDRFLRQLDTVREGQSFIITVDEFEMIEEAVNEGRLDPRLLDFWRGVIQTYPWFVMAFAGLHTLEEMRHDYWNPLFGSVSAIEISFLSPEATRQLLSQPSEEFDIDYDAAAIEHVSALTNGQPYLVQLIGHNLVTCFNRQVFEEGVQRPRRFTLEDVQAVIDAPVFFRDGDAYFDGVWVQARDTLPVGQTRILESICTTPAGKSLAEIAGETGLSANEAKAALDTLKRHDVVVECDSRYAFTVELMRRWVVQRREKHTV